MIKEKIVYAQGTWDLFHVGHINILRKAHKMARRLIVGVNTDRSVKKHKGYFPVISYRDRVETMRACRYVDKVIKSDLTFNISELKKYKIEVLVLGSDWEGISLAGVHEAKEIGVKIIYFPYTKSISSTEIKKRIKNER